MRTWKAKYSSESMCTFIVWHNCDHHQRSRMNGVVTSRDGCGACASVPLFWWNHDYTIHTHTCLCVRKSTGTDIDVESCVLLNRNSAVSNVLCCTRKIMFTLFRIWSSYFSLLCCRLLSLALGVYTYGNWYF